MHLHYNINPRRRMSTGLESDTGEVYECRKSLERVCLVMLRDLHSFVLLQRIATNCTAVRLYCDLRPVYCRSRRLCCAGPAHLQSFAFERLRRTYMQCHLYCPGHPWLTVDVLKVPPKDCNTIHAMSPVVSCSDVLKVPPKDCNTIHAMSPVVSCSPVANCRCRQG